MSIPNPPAKITPDKPIQPHVALPLIHNRAERLAADLQRGRRIADASVTDAVAGIAADLADVVAQLVPAVSQ